jgi:hypothetical protein
MYPDHHPTARKHSAMKNNEQTGLKQARDLKVPWKKWGPYLSERQWGIVREDYSESGDAWKTFQLVGSK